MAKEGIGSQLGLLSHVDRGPSDTRFLEEDRLLTALLGEALDEGEGIGVRRSFGWGSGRKKRKRKQLYTQLLTQYPALLDDQSPATLRLLLRKTHHWQFNPFHLHRFSGGHSLSTLCTHLFHITGLISSFTMDSVEVMSFLRLVERGYQSSNPYHTSLHAADVTQAIAVFCNQPCFARHLTKLEVLAVLTAAMCHDLDHPGVNEKFLVSTESHLAVLYDNVSVLENHHWRSGISCFVESGLSKYLTDAQFSEFTDLVRTLVLATDISRQQEFLTQFRYFLDTGQTDMSQQNLRHFLLQIAIKCADISNPCRTWQVSRLWSLRACEEFFRQGDSERALGLSVTPICDRFNVTVAKVQVGFYSFVAEPLFREWHRLLNSSLSEEMLANLYSNQSVWEREVLEEGLNNEVTPEAQIVEEVKPPVNIMPPTILKLSSAQRRLSLPATDPLHRMFDQMTQPGSELTRGAALRRNFSLTDRRRSSLLRGLHNRSSLKPIRGRANRPASMSLENADNIRLSRRINEKKCRDKEGEDRNRTSEFDIKDPECMEVEFEKENSIIHSALPSHLTKRRGSAPCSLVLGECKMLMNPSVPLPSVIRQQDCFSLSSNRRGSLPSELITNSLPKQMRTRVLATANSANKRPGILRRRSMGAELLSLGNRLSTVE